MQHEPNLTDAFEEVLRVILKNGRPGGHALLWLLRIIKWCLDMDSICTKFYALHNYKPTILTYLTHICSTINRITDEFLHRFGHPVWNKLPQNSVVAESLRLLKLKLRSFLLSLPAACFQLSYHHFFQLSSLLGLSVCFSTPSA